MNKYTIWGYWFLTVIFLGISLFVWPKAIYLTIAINFTHSVHFILRKSGMTTFPMQVRLGYLGLLILGLAPIFSWVHWIQLIGGTIMLTTGYCPMARMLSLLPWNRNKAMSWSLIKIVLFTPPVSGSFEKLVYQK